jgi:pentatricopeptide repeat protein
MIKQLISMTIGSLLFFISFHLFAQTNPVLEQDVQALLKMKQGQAQVTKGIDRFRAGDMTAARKILEACVAASPLSHEASFILAQICYRDSDFAGALNWINKADAGFVQLQETLARARENQSQIDIDKRQELGEIALDLLNQSRHAQCSQEKLRLTGSQLDQKSKGLHGEQNDALLTGLDLPPDYAYMQGNILFRLKRLDEAESWYKNAIHGNPQHVASYNNLINLLFMNHRLADARQWLEEAEKKNLKINQKLAQAIRQSH